MHLAKAMTRGGDVRLGPFPVSADPAGARRNEWSVSVSDNWRITFEERDGGIERVNLEDYH